MNSRWWVIAAVLVPLAGIIALVGRAELARLGGPIWQVPITGYDPRDLLHGRYLRYQYRLNWQGTSTCGSQGTLGADCCLCLTRTNPQGIDPAVRQVPCDDVSACDDWLRSAAIRPPLRYFVPEDRASELDRAFIERAASLELSCSPGGNPAVRGLFLDGRPWREALADAPR